MNTSTLLCLICFVASSVIVAFSKPWPAFFQELFAATSLLFLTLGLSLKQQRFYLHPLMLLLALMLGVCVVQYFAGVIFFAGDAWIVCLYLLAALCACACGYQRLLSGGRDQAMFLWCALLLVISLPQIFFACYQFFAWDFLQGWLVARAPTDSRVVGQLGQPNNFASLLVWCLLAGLYVFEKGYGARIVHWLWQLLIIAALLAAGSRTTLLVFFIVALFFAVEGRRYCCRLQAKDGVWLVLCCLLAWQGLPLLKEMLFALPEAGREVGVYDGSRLAIWTEALQAIWQGPWWGYGWNQIGVAQILVASDLDKVLYFRHSHNLILDLLLYNGPLIGGGLVLALLYWGWRSLRACRTLEGCFILAMLASIFIHAMLELPLHYAYFLLPAAFLLGMADSPLTSPIRGYASYWHLPVALLAFLLLAQVVQDYRIMQQESYALEQEVLRGQARKLGSEATDNIRLMSQQRERIHYGRYTVTDALSKEELHWMKQVSHRFASPYFLGKYAKAAYLNGDEAEAQRVLAVVKRLHGDALHARAVNEVYGASASTEVSNSVNRP